MPIPDYQTLMRPLLRLISDGQIYSTQNAVEKLAKEFKLTDEELNEWLPSKKQRIFHNRVHWAKAHLKMSGAIENVSKGLFKITDRGRLALQDAPTRINVKYLMNLFPDYGERINEFRFKRKDKDANQSVKSSTEEDNNATPEELIESGYQKIRATLENDILNTLKSVSPSSFEKIVIGLLVVMGYGGSLEDAGKVVGKVGDEGIDGIIKEDKLGLDIIYIQAKRWEGIVGRPELHKFVGALAGQGAKKGIFITTSSFTKDAISYNPKNETKIVLIDGAKLAQYMIDHNLGVTTRYTYELKEIDTGYFEE